MISMILGIGLKLHDSGILSTSDPLDRESTTTIPFQLVCTIDELLSTGLFTTQNTVVQNGTLLVEDEDDNPPRLQSSDVQKIIDVYLKDKGIVQVKELICFIDFKQISTTIS